MNDISFVNVVDTYKKGYTEIGMLGILSLATVLKRDTNHNVRVLDFQHEYKLRNYKPNMAFEDEIESLFLFIMKDINGTKENSEKRINLNIYS